jgi:hypothetical protein
MYVCVCAYVQVGVGQNELKRCCLRAQKKSDWGKIRTAS